MDPSSLSQHSPGHPVTFGQRLFPRQMDARDAFNRAWGRFVNRSHSTQPLLIFLLVIALASLFIPTLNTEII